MLLFFFKKCLGLNIILPFQLCKIVCLRGLLIVLVRKADITETNEHYNLMGRELMQSRSQRHPTTSGGTMAFFLPWFAGDLSIHLENFTPNIKKGKGSARQCRENKLMSHHWLTNTIWDVYSDIYDCARSNFIYLFNLCCNNSCLFVPQMPYAFLPTCLCSQVYIFHIYPLSLATNFYSLFKFTLLKY